jgi:hypothetical protein
MTESDQGRWLTYAEAGALLGISAQAARMLAKRRGWARRTPNAYGDRAQVLVPSDAIVQPRSPSDAVRTGSVITSDQPHANGHDQVNVRALEQAIEVLRDQLGVANRRGEDEHARADRAEERADRAECRADDERDRADRERDRATQAEQRVERASARVQELTGELAKRAAVPTQEPPRTRWRRLLRVLGHTR